MRRREDQPPRVRACGRGGGWERRAAGKAFSQARSLRAALRTRASSESLLEGRLERAFRARPRRREGGDGLARLPRAYLGAQLVVLDRIARDGELLERRVDVEHLRQRLGAAVADEVERDVKHLERGVDLERLRKIGCALVAEMVLVEVELADARVGLQELGERLHALQPARVATKVELRHVGHRLEGLHQGVQPIGVEAVPTHVDLGDVWVTRRQLSKHLNARALQLPAAGIKRRVRWVLAL
mmetsp:Transcript_42411/g.99354  ORF Transcript_42411/g.99354 Transcript_42411/m.99354 type:complete len:243 (+) Transcript_42411:78-806(+)